MGASTTFDMECEMAGGGVFKYRSTLRSKYLTPTVYPVSRSRPPTVSLPPPPLAPLPYPILHCPLGDVPEKGGYTTQRYDSVTNSVGEYYHQSRRC